MRVSGTGREPGLPELWRELLIEDSPQALRERHVTMEHRFTALRAIAVTFKIIAWFILVVGVLISLLTLFAGFATPMAQFGGVGGAFAAFLGFIFVLLLTAIYFLSTYAIGEGIYLFLAIEENTREASRLLRERSNPPSQIG